MIEATRYDKKEEYKKNCVKLVDELCNTCTRLGIPIFISAAVENNDNETIYQNDGYMAGSSSIVLHDDKFGMYVMVAGGNCKVVSDEEDMVLDESYFDNYEMSDQ